MRRVMLGLEALPRNPKRFSSNRVAKLPQSSAKPSRCSARVDADATCPPHEFGLLARAYRSRHAGSALSAGGVELEAPRNWPVPSFIASRPAGLWRRPARASPRLVPRRVSLGLSQDQRAAAYRIGPIDQIAVISEVLGVDT
jgi:hypothetical protein